MLDIHARKAHTMIMVNEKGNGNGRESVVAFWQMAHGWFVAVLHGEGSELLMRNRADAKVFKSGRAAKAAAAKLATERGLQLVEG